MRNGGAKLCDGDGDGEDALEGAFGSNGGVVVVEGVKNNNNNNLGLGLLLSGDASPFTPSSPMMTTNVCTAAALGAERRRLGLCTCLPASKVAEATHSDAPRGTM